jgi:hypothetical protein
MNLSKGIVYYTDNRLDPLIMQAVQRQIRKAALPVVSVSLAALDFGTNIVMSGIRGPLTMFRQILAGLEASKAEIIFFCEHDILYHPAHFDFIPLRRDVYYYNENIYKVEYPGGRSLFYFCQQTSGLCAYRKLLVEHYRERVRRVEQDGYSMAMGFEPGTHNRPERVDKYMALSWMSAAPNIDIRHAQNLTRSRWSKDQFRNKKYTAGWKEVNSVPGWGDVANGGIVDILKNA